MTTPRAQPRVLLVEDHQDTRNMYAAFFGQRFDVVLAKDGEEAFQAMRDEVPDLVITDLGLPGMDGVTIIRRMREDPSLSGVPVICLSGFGGEYGARAKDAGATRVLHKPCLPDALAEVVAELLRFE